MKLPLIESKFDKFKKIAELHTKPTHRETSDSFRLDYDPNAVPKEEQGNVTTPLPDSAKDEAIKTETKTEIFKPNNEAIKLNKIKLPSPPSSGIALLLTLIIVILFVVFKVKGTGESHLSFIWETVLGKWHIAKSSLSGNPDDVNAKTGIDPNKNLTSVAGMRNDGSAYFNTHLFGSPYVDHIVDKGLESTSNIGMVINDFLMK